MTLTRSRRGVRAAQALGLAVAVLALLGLGGGTAAAQGTIIERTTTINALASGSSCTTGDDGTEACVELNLHVSPGKFGESLIVCLGLTTTSGERFRNEEGCADVAATFSMDSDELSWASLADTPVDLFSPDCDPETKECGDPIYSRTVTLTATWTATGELVRVKETLGNPHGPCTVTDKIDGFVRDAAATVTIDGVSFQAAGNLQVLDSKTAYRTNCR